MTKPQSFSIWIVSPSGYLHSRCFEEVALALHCAFKTLGYDAPIHTQPPQDSSQVLVLGTNLLTRITEPLPEQMILYNLEQIEKTSGWITPAYIQLLKRHAVWDYSQHNMKTLKKLFGVQATHLALGYVPELTRIKPRPKDIDVLFIGSLSERRKKVLEALAATGRKVSAAYNSYGPERDALIARSKIIINIHYYEAQLFEVVRVSYLLANKACVVSETGRDMQLEAPYKQAVAWADYDKLIDTCLALLADEKARKAQEKAGFDSIKNQPQAPILQRALADLQIMPHRKSS